MHPYPIRGRQISLVRTSSRTAKVTQKALSPNLPLPKIKTNNEPIVILLRAEQCTVS